jgi:hypothetical protein
MSDNKDDRLENLLRRRHVEPASANLAERIILRTRNLPQRQDPSLWSALRRLFAEFHLPKPGYVLASALVLGIVLGYSTAPDNAVQGDLAATAAPSYIGGDEELL